MNKFSKTFRMILLCLLLLTSMCVFAFGMGLGAVKDQLGMALLGAAGWFVSVMGMAKALNMDTQPDPVDGAQIVFRDHRGMSRDIAAPMPLQDALQVAHVMSDGHAITRGIPSMFFVPAFRCPGGTLMLRRTGNYQKPLTTTTTK